MERNSNPGDMSMSPGFLYDLTSFATCDSKQIQPARSPVEP
jgi:hypothetical protein